MLSLETPTVIVSSKRSEEICNLLADNFREDYTTMVLPGDLGSDMIIKITNDSQYPQNSPRPANVLQARRIASLPRCV